MVWCGIYMIVKLLEGRNPIIDLEITIRKLERDIKFYRGKIFPDVDIDDAEIRLKEYKDASRFI